MSSVSLAQARAVKGLAKQVFAKFGPVAGVGLTRVGSDYAVKVNLEMESDPGVEMPDSLEGVPVKVEIVGKITKRPAVSPNNS